MDDFGFYYKGYKQFRDWQAFSPLNKVNLVIGKNNAGKTKLCEVALTFYQPDYSYTAGSDFPIIPCLGTGKELLPAVLRRHFQPLSPSIKAFSDLLGDRVPIPLSYGLGDPAYADLLRTRFGELYSSLQSSALFRGAFVDLSGMLYDAFKEDRKKHPSIISYIHSDREVLSSPNSAMIFPDGGPVFQDNDATRLAYYFLNYADGDETIILEKVRSALNRVMGEEGQYSSISVKQVTNDKNDPRYEVFVEDAKTKKRYALSECGNGLQTIFLVLLSLYANKPNDKMLSRLFIFEELENNLHPYAERRLYQLILEYSKEVPGRRFIITTHSNAAIDVFSGSSDCSLFSVEKDENNPEFSIIRSLSTNDDVSEAIANLGVKASDLLQANGLLWVEGPSDRLYLNKWIHLLDPTLTENVHYQFAYYGGRLLAHYTADEENSLIRILTINRHSALFMDSDKSKEDDQINQTKKRILDEMGEDVHPAFITAGREIENYIPLAVVRDLAHDDCLAFSAFDDIAPIAKKVMNDRSEDPNHFDKIAFAKKACDKITAENLNVLHLKQTIEKVIDAIRKWNGIS